MKFSKLAMVCVAGLAFGAPAMADDHDYQIDVNDMNANTSGGAFSTAYTGSVSIATDGNSLFAGMRIDGDDQTLTSALQSLSVTFNLVNGLVVNGSVSLSAADGSQYTAGLVAGEGGGVKFQAGQGFSIDSLVSNPHFNAATFAGVDVSFFTGPHQGSVLMFSFDPGTGTSDSDTDFEIFGNVPTPGSLGLIGLGGLAALRRRR